MQFKVETGQKVWDIQGHNGDVAALSLNPKDPNMFMTGSVDRTTRLWDLRVPGCVQTFWGHQVSLLHSHWSRSNEARLSLVERIIVLLCQLSYAIKNQLGPQRTW